MWATVQTIFHRFDTIRPVPMTVLIVDDHPSFRGSARALLEAEGYEVVGEAENGLDGLDAARALRPDLVLLDVQLPDIDGFEVASRLTQDAGAPAVVLISRHPPPAASSSILALVGRVGRGRPPPRRLRKVR